MSSLLPCRTTASTIPPTSTSTHRAARTVATTGWCPEPRRSGCADATASWWWSSITSRLQGGGAAAAGGPRGSLLRHERLEEQPLPRLLPERGARTTRVGHRRRRVLVGVGHLPRVAIVRRERGDRPRRDPPRVLHTPGVGRRGRLGAPGVLVHGPVAALLRRTPV